jgi:CRISPR-associated protein Csm4
MKIYRIKLRPLSAWRSEWQADTIAGLLCWTVARNFGGEILQNEILQKCADGKPPFVLSDAFPFDYLPIPEIARLRIENPSKEIKKSRWLSPEIFKQAQNGEILKGDDFIKDDFIHRETHMHNTLDRLNDTTGDGGGLFALTDFFGRTEKPDDEFYLSVYARIEENYVARLSELFRLLSESGFGADISTGKGQFEVLSDFEECDWLDQVDGETNGITVLSTFQPAETDPTEGVWESFVKFGKIGADFGLENVFKRPLLLFKPGACFQTGEQKHFVGRIIPINELLDNSQIAQIEKFSANINQLCYGLAVPQIWKVEL